MLISDDDELLKYQGRIALISNLESSINSMTDKLSILL